MAQDKDLAVAKKNRAEEDAKVLQDFLASFISDGQTETSVNHFTIKLIEGEYVVGR